MSWYKIREVKTLADHLFLKSPVSFSETFRSFERYFQKFLDKNV